jgi:hypothetical protein
MPASASYPEPERLWPRDVTPELPSFDDDWFRFYYDPPAETDKARASGRVRYFEVHELDCTRQQCAFRAWDRDGCPFHPPGCECSRGACQEPPVAELEAER